jgi:hypothetical protein
MGSSSSKNKTELVDSIEKKTLFPKRLFPKNLIIIIGTHGEILDEKFVPGISIYKFNLAPAGKPAFVSGAHSEQIPSSLDPEDSACFLSGTNDISEWGNIITDAITEYSNIDIDINNTIHENELQEFMKDIQTKIKDKYSENIGKKRTRVDLVSNSCKINSLSCKTEMVNKVYFIGNEHSPDPRNWGITAVNSTQPYFDILKAVYDSRKPKRIEGYKIQVTTEQIIEYLLQNGVEKCLFFDFSCAEYFETDERRKRVTIREVAKNNNFGGSTFKKSTFKKGYAKRRAKKRTKKNKKEKKILKNIKKY